MKKIYTTIALAILGLTSIESMGQVGLNRADREYDKYAYIDAIKIYEQIAQRGNASSETLQKLGNAYYFNGEYAQAGAWYGKLFEEQGSTTLEPEYYYRYAQTLKSLGKVEESKQYLSKFSQSTSDSSRAALLKQESVFASEIQKNSGRYRNLTNLSINSAYSDYGSFVTNNELLFTTARDTGNFVKREHTWTGDAFTTIHSGNLEEDSNVKTSKRLSSKITSKFNESTPIISADGNTMYFTRNNYNGSRGFDAEKTTLLKIYRSLKDKHGNWSKAESLSINSDAFSSAHPALSSDGNTLYFASDRPGGFGLSDIWKVAIKADGSLGTPQNLGDKINTGGRETFPFVTSSNQLYFSTDARPGLGGLDVYASQLKTDGSLTDAQNVGSPVNSEWDDFAYYINPTNHQGFFSSNRPEGKGKDDIYSFVETRSLTFECLQQLKIRVIDSQSKEVISNAKVTAYDENYSALESTRQYANNGYVFSEKFECGATYRFKAEHPDYLTNEVSVSLPNESGETERTIALERKKIDVKPGDDLFKKLNLKPIYFDLDKSNIRQDAALELEKVLAVLKEYPLMKIDIRSHTDSRASHKYNDQLSDRRAKSTREWLISQGISSSRLGAKGYGERELENKCSDGVNCTEEQHQQNRRSEFIIIEM